MKNVENSELEKISFVVIREKLDGVVIRIPANFTDVLKEDVSVLSNMERMMIGEYMTDKTLITEWWEMLIYDNKVYWRKTAWKTHRVSGAAT